MRVPFRDKSGLATVVALLEQSEAKGIRPIEAVVGEAPIVSEPMLELARWISAYYCCPIETVMRSLLPQVIRRAEVGWKKQLFVQPGRKIDNAEIEKLRKRAPRQAELLEAISRLEAPVRAAQLLRQTSLDNQTLRALVKRGLAELREEAVVRDPHADEQFIATSNLILNEEQTVALEEIDASARVAGRCAPDLAARRDRQRQDGNLFAGDSRHAQPRAHRDCAGPGDFAYAANGRAFQRPLRRRRRMRLRYCTAIYPRANATMNGTRFIPVAPIL